MKINSYKIGYLLLIFSLLVLSCSKKVIHDTFVQGIIVDSSTNEPLPGTRVSIYYKSQRSFLLNNKFLLDKKVSEQSGKFSLSFNSSEIFRDYIFEIEIENSDDFSLFKVELPIIALEGQQTLMDTIRLKRMTRFIVQYENNVVPISINDEISCHMGSRMGDFSSGFTSFRGSGEMISGVEPKKKYYIKFEIKKANGDQYSIIDSSEFIWKKRNEYKIEY